MAHFHTNGDLQAYHSSSLKPCLSRPIPWRAWGLVIEILKNTLCFNYNFRDPVRSQMCTCHDSWAVATYAKFWSDWIMIIQGISTYIFTRFELWSLKRIVIWLPSLEVPHVIVNSPAATNLSIKYQHLFLWWPRSESSLAPWDPPLNLATYPWWDLERWQAKLMKSTNRNLHSHLMKSTLVTEQWKGCQQLSYTLNYRNEQ